MLGDIITVFLPDPAAFEEQLFSLGIDISPVGQPTSRQLQQLKQLLLTHVVPNVFLLNMDMLSVNYNTRLKCANGEIIGISTNDNQDIILTPQNVRVLSAQPSFACQGFLYLLDGVLIQTKSFDSALP
eukprot:TRINITY_DN23269_c0_g1_i3.p4 TRINITY_DN23269_c0_g1~~TRINITY_DN23269_c0_g1_i3.p4  ORF type:complete len:128 (+),score=15.80 TRINITY_DN23269_c0_g1_i3:126-509(+)